MYRKVERATLIAAFIRRLQSTQRDNVRCSVRTVEEYRCTRVSPAVGRWNIYPSATVSLSFCRSCFYLFSCSIFLISNFPAPICTPPPPSPSSITGLAALLALGVLYACPESTAGVGSLRFNRCSYPQYLPAARARPSSCDGLHDRHLIHGI
ncbi:hypothetical protein CTA1_7276 [Colletotrichum tanaceti]|uniref:Uncharacterized protein n=1 Tax=Colletotrichum tanaceti TaxID=1306861 RepID=A0A4U6XBB7_9PEZI|nr:hypothetical protein CTA1_7276 [Colletotrichum tanaceti]